MYHTHTHTHTHHTDTAPTLCWLCIARELLLLRRLTGLGTCVGTCVGTRVGSCLIVRLTRVGLHPRTLTILT